MAIPATTYDIATISNPTSALTDFTLIVDLSNMSTAWWSAVNTTDGTKGRASKSDGITELACDFIDFDSTLETGILRVKYTGTLASTGTQQIRVYPPNTANTSYLATDTYGQYNAYRSTFMHYYPLEDLTDRSSNQRNGALLGTPTSGATGKIADAYEFTSDGQGIDLGAITIGNGFSNGFTLSAWVNADTSLPRVGQIISADGATNRVWQLRAGLDGTITFIRFNSSGSVVSNFTGTTDIRGAGWVNVVATFDTSNGSEILINDATDASDSTVTANGDNNTPIVIGNISRDGNNNSFGGLLDEVQIHTVRLTDAFRSQEYSQTNDNATFWGTWTNVPLSGGYTLTAEAGTLSITGQTAALKLDRKLIANSGSLSIIGNEASLTINRILQANTGSLTITGQDANIVYGKGYILSADAGAIIITGQPVSLTKTNVLTAESGSLNISGRNVTLTYSGAVSAYYEIVNINGALTTKTTLDASLITIKSINGEIL